MAEEEVHHIKARPPAGTAPHIVRYILAISLALAILAYIVIRLV